MEGEEAQKQGTQLIDVLQILEGTSQERLLSLTYQLREHPEEVIVHAMSLIILQRGKQALDKLHTLQERKLAGYLAERLHISGGKLTDFRVACNNFQDTQVDTLVDLARIFKVLTEQRLCDTSLRDLAYQRAVLANKRKGHHQHTGTGIDLLTEEAKRICGPAEWLLSLTRQQQASQLVAGLDNGNTALKYSLSLNQPTTKNSLPSSLKPSSSMMSYPSKLEISLPPISNLSISKKTSTMQVDPIKTNVLEYTVENGVNNMPTKDANLMPKQPFLYANLPSACNNTESHTTWNPNHNTPTLADPEPKSLASSAKESLHENKTPKQTHYEGTSMATEEEEKAVFYSFVILHAPEDLELATSLKEKFESYGVGEGATFTEDFAVPGRSTLRCVEDAIDNSAFTILLLTRNFNTDLLKLNTDSALINSLNKKHKHNTVIPLLPQQNCLPRSESPLVLQTVNPLIEGHTLEKKLKKALSPEKIESQKKVWIHEQKLKEEKARQEMLRINNRLRKQLIDERNRMLLLTQEQQRLFFEQQQQSMRQTPFLSQGAPAFPYFGSHFSSSPVPPQQVNADQWPWRPPPGNITIQNAKYIMVGDNSQMTLSLAGDEDDDDLGFN